MIKNARGMKSVRREATRPDETQPASSGDVHAPRKMSVGENVVLTIKVLVGFGLLGAALWGINLWTAPK